MVQGNCPEREEKDEGCKDEALFQPDDQMFYLSMRLLVNCRTFLHFLPESVKKDLVGMM